MILHSFVFPLISIHSTWLQSSCMHNDSQSHSHTAISLVTQLFWNFFGICFLTLCRFLLPTTMFESLN